jgi:SpoIIAA-like
MPFAMQPEGDNVYCLELLGTLRKTEFEQCEKLLADEMRRVGSLKLLFVLKEFQGWEPHADWNDLTFYVKHGDAIERIAIVGDLQWRSQALMFAAEGLRRAPVRFFADDEVANARAWLTDDTGAGTGAGG